LTPVVTATTALIPGHEVPAADQKKLPSVYKRTSVSCVSAVRQGWQVV
jgi:hypothetical protein